MKSIDESVLVDKGLPKTWECPHCHNRNRMGRYKEEEFFEFFQTMQHCDRCGHIHHWTLKLTEDFKKKAIAMLLKEVEG